MTTQAAGDTETIERPVESPAEEMAWVTIVWDDPVNLMAYVTYVFRSYFGYPERKAHSLMMQVHTKGKAVVSSGRREQMETDADAMHSFGLWATIEKAS